MYVGGWGEEGLGLVSCLTRSGMIDNMRRKKLSVDLLAQVRSLARIFACHLINPYQVLFELYK